MLARARSLLVMFMALALTLVAPAIPTASASWSTQFALPTINDEIEVATTRNGKLVLGGRFTRAGKLAASRVVAWNGSSYEALGNGLPTTVTVLGANGGELYAFTPASGPTPNTLWKWNGIDWASFVTFPSGQAITAITSHLGQLHVGGSFTSIDGVAASRVARFDGNNWSAVGAVNLTLVSSLASFGGALYAGGTAPVGAGNSALFAWDGSAWSVPGGGVTSPSGQAQVRSLLAHGSGLIVGGGYYYVGGSFATIGALACSSPARWTGSAWECLTAPFASGPSQLVDFAGDIVGTVQMPNSGASYWSGSAWVGFQDDLVASGSLALGTLGSELYILGGFLHGETLAWKRWDGTVWSAPDPWEPGMRGLGHQVLEFVPYGGELVALGSFTYFGSEGHLTQARRIAAWNGSDWEPLAAGLSLTPLDATTFEGDLVVGGYIAFSGSTTIKGVARWNGTAWSGFGAGLTYPESGQPFPVVYGVAVHGTALVACGEFTTSGTSTVTGIARWDGTAWQPLGTGFDVLNYDDVPYTLLSDGADLYAGGSFIAAGGVPAARIARWDGASWHAVGSGFADGEVNALTKFENEVVAGGTFSVTGGSPANGAARLRNGAWIPMGTNAIEVNDFDIHGGALHAAGKFLREDLTTHIGLARWDGSTWVPLGGTATGSFANGYAVASLGDQVFLGGRFDFVEGVPSVNIAAWKGSPVASVPGVPGPRASFAMPRPNPARSSVEFTFTLHEPAHVRLVILDLQGRQVALLEDDLRGAGTRSLSWDGRLSGGRLALGVYQAVLEHPGGRIAHPLIWLR